MVILLVGVCGCGTERVWKGFGEDCGNSSPKACGANMAIRESLLICSNDICALVFSTEGTMPPC